MVTRSEALFAPTQFVSDDGVYIANQLQVIVNGLNTPDCPPPIAELLPAIRKAVEAVCGCSPEYSVDRIIITLQYGRIELPTVAAAPCFSRKD